MISSGTCAPPPPPMTNGTIPAQRIQVTSNPSNQIPSCVQNAMMTKDKKPFSYTPSGLGEIKSPTLARRIQKNANLEGITNDPKPAVTSHGFYNGNSNGLNVPANGVPPPPPPTMNKLHLSPQPARANRSPSPQIFEPPPLGCRPEIKIPPNPMASLRKVSSPKPKDDFWKDEYIRERSKSPMPGTEESNGTNQNSNTTEFKPAPQPVQQPRQQPIQRQYSNDASRFAQYPIPEPSAPAPASIQNTFNRQPSFKNEFEQSNQPSSPLRSTFNRQPSLKNEFEQPNQPSSPLKNTFNRQPSFKNEFESQPTHAPVRITFNRQPSLKNERDVNNNNTNNSYNSFNSQQNSAPASVQPPWRSNQRQRSPAPASVKANQNQSTYPSYQPNAQRNNVGYQPVNTASQQPNNAPFYSRSNASAQQPPQQQQQPRYELPSTSNRSVPAIPANSFMKEPGRQFAAAPQTPSQPTNQSVEKTRAVPPFLTKRSNSRELPNWAAQNEVNQPQNHSQQSPWQQQNHQAQPPQQQWQKQPQSQRWPSQNNQWQPQQNNNHQTPQRQQQRQPESFYQPPKLNKSLYQQQQPQPTFETFGRPANNGRSNAPQNDRFSQRYQPQIIIPTTHSYEPNWNGDQNKYVDQGYGRWNGEPQLIILPSNSNISCDGGRIVPIRLEADHPYLKNRTHL